MPNIPDDIFTEPEVSPDTLTNLGPLRCLAGVWASDEVGICSTAFLEEAFRTDYYRIDITFNSDDSWTYVPRADLAVRGKMPPFDHRDTNTLCRTARPEPNPLFAAVGQK